MNKQFTLMASAFIFVGAVGGFLITHYVQNKDLHTLTVGDNTFTPPGMHRMPDGTLMPHADMGGADQMDHMMAMMVSSEREFIAGMIPHHQEAVDTAKEVLARGGTTHEIRQLVADIVVAQEREIADMKTWYEGWYGEPYTESDNYMPMMRDLRELSGAELDRTFLEDMIPHHMGAIMMARSVQPYIEHEEIAVLAAEIIRTQAEEIRLMQRLLQTL